MAGGPDDAGVRAAEIVASLCLATDLGMGFPLEHGLHSTVVAMRLAERLAVDDDVGRQTYYGCMLFYCGCTADAEVAAEMFPEGALLEHFIPVVFGSARELVTGIARALSPTDSPLPVRAAQLLWRLPHAAVGHTHHIDAMCQVASMIAARTGMPQSVRALSAVMSERWDGHGHPGRLSGVGLPLALRIIHVARDACFQRLLHGPDAVEVVRRRAGGAFDPVVVACLTEDFERLTAAPAAAWDELLALEPPPHLRHTGPAVDEALAAMGDFSDLVSPHLTGHSGGVAALAGSAATLQGLSADEVRAVRRAGWVHDLGRVAAPARIWASPAPLSAADWELVRLHPYHSERVLVRSPYLAGLAPVAGAHHERLDGSGYHRGTTASGLPRTARLLAAADAFHAKTEHRAHRPAQSPAQVADHLAAEVAAGRLDATAVAAVVEAAGLPAPRVPRPAGLTEREAQVLGMISHGRQTKQVARALGISVKTADRHIQNTYAKIGVSTRAAAAMFAMQHGVALWGEVPIPRGDADS